MKKRMSTFFVGSKTDIKKEAYPFFLILGMRLSRISSNVGFFTSAAFASAKAFFHTKKKIREMQMKKEKVLDLRKHHLFNR